MRTDEHVKRDGEANRDSDIDWSYLGVAVRDGVVMRAVEIFHNDSPDKRFDVRGLRAPCRGSDVGEMHFAAVTPGVGVGAVKPGSDMTLMVPLLVLTTASPGL
jgi:hypothetical protein